MARSRTKSADSYVTDGPISAPERERAIGRRGVYQGNLPGVSDREKLRPQYGMFYARRFDRQMSAGEMRVFAVGRTPYSRAALVFVAR